MSKISRGTVLWVNPIIAYTAQIEAETCLIRTLGDQISDRRAIFLPLIAWSAESPQVAHSICEKARSYIDQHPLHDIIFMCNTSKEVEIIRSFGIKAEHFNHNAFVDPDLYAIGTRQALRYNAVYNAQLQPWKRHGLARFVEKVAFLYHSYNPSQERYRQGLVGDNPQAVFVNHELISDVGRNLSKQEVQNILAQSRVGLCLSEREGAMHASVEYLLAGLPVVSTVNQGGRNEFLSSENSIIVEPDASCVSKAVCQMLNNEVDPICVRRETMARQQIVLGRFKSFVQSLIDSEGSSGSFDAVWSSVYRDKMLGWETADQIIKMINDFRIA